MRRPNRLSFLPKRLEGSRGAGWGTRLVLYLGLTIVFLLRLFSYPTVEETVLHHSIVSIFKPFKTDRDARSQLTALSSWLGLHPTPTIYVILDHEQSIDRIQRSFKSNRVYFVRQIHRGFHGIPLFHAIFHVASSLPQRGIVTLVNSDIHVLQRYVDALIHVDRWSRRVGRDKGYFVTSARIDVGQSIEVTETYGQNREDAILHTFGGLDAFSWTTRSQIFINQSLPPFIWGKSRCDNWFLNQVIADGLVDVVDATELGSIVHYQHSRPYLGNQSDETINEVNIWTSVQFSNWYAYVNGVLSFQYGDYKGHLGTGRHAEFKISPCEEDTSMCMIRRVRPSICPCEYASFMPQTQTDPMVRHGDTIECGKISLDSAEDFPLSLSKNRKVTHHTPLHELEELAEYLGKEQPVLILVCTSVDQLPALMEAFCHAQSLQMHPLVITSDELCWSQLFVLSVAVYFHSIDKDWDEQKDDMSVLQRQIMINSTVSLLAMGRQVMWAGVSDIGRIKDISFDTLKDNISEDISANSARDRSFLYDCAEHGSLSLHRTCIIYVSPELGSVKLVEKLREVEKANVSKDHSAAKPSGNVLGVILSERQEDVLSSAGGTRVQSITWQGAHATENHFDRDRSLCVQK